jgi:hypothetical protein
VSDLFFFVRMMVMTVLVVFALQIRVGDQTLEQSSQALITASVNTLDLQKVADGGVRLLRDTWNGVASRVANGVGSVFSAENRPGERRLIPALERSREYLGQKADEAKEQGRQAISATQRTWSESTRHLADHERVKKLRSDLTESGVIQPTTEND